MFTLRQKWLPDQPDNEKNLARGIWLEKSYWTNMSNAISSGIARAFKGK